MREAGPRDVRKQKFRHYPVDIRISPEKLDPKFPEESFMRQKSLLLIPGIAVLLAAIVPASVMAQATASPANGQVYIGA